MWVLYFFFTFNAYFSLIDAFSVVNIYMYTLLRIILHFIVYFNMVIRNSWTIDRLSSCFLMETKVKSIFGYTLVRI